MQIRLKRIYCICQCIYSSKASGLGVFTSVQIDGSTLRTICLQHGPLLTFHLGLTQGSALIRYCSPHEAAKAQSALHM